MAACPYGNYPLGLGGNGLYREIGGEVMKDSVIDILCHL